MMVVSPDALGLWPIVELVVGAAIILCGIYAYLWLNPGESQSDFAWFWFNIENPASQSGSSIVSIMLAIPILLIAVVLGYFVLTHIQGSIPNCNILQAGKHLLPKFCRIILNGAVQ